MLTGTVTGFVGASLLTIAAPDFTKSVTTCFSDTANVIIIMGTKPAEPSRPAGPETYGLPAPSETPLAAGARVDRIIVAKAARRLTIFSQGKPLKTYRISLGFAPLGHKQQEGDGKTPEGTYTISARNPQSAYHLSLRVSYPSPADRQAAHQRGVSPGGDIMIHGLPNGLPEFGFIHRSSDWTAGCIAVTDEEIRELWSAVPNGVVIEIKP